jgi:hypothetical protein
MRWHKKVPQESVTVRENLVHNLIHANHMITNHAVEVLLSDISTPRGKNISKKQKVKTKSKIKRLKCALNIKIHKDFIFMFINF